MNHVFYLHVHFHAKLTHFHLNGFALSTFQTEVKGNSEMANWITGLPVSLVIGQNDYLGFSFALNEIVCAVTS